MAKVKSIFFCQNCGNSSPKWLGKCSACGEWNTYVEEKTSSKKKHLATDFLSKTEVVKLNDVEVQDFPRIETASKEFDRVIGGGIVPGSVVLIGGEPGIGKSTLLLQLSLRFEKKVLYVSGEESATQIKLRADRITQNESQCHIYAETNLQSILQKTKEIQPDLVIIDSIQTIASELIESYPGSISQVRECAGEIIHMAKTNATPVILVGHINKEGSIAGPKVLEHMVDTVLQFEGDRNHVYRILRSSKNRFGSAQELGIFEMVSGGLKEIKNPNEVLINKDRANLSGVAIGVSLEGNRPLLIEAQALVSSAVYGTPQRSSTGFDLRRLNMLLAVLEKRCGFRLGAKDVFLNIAGGLKIDDPAMDLAVACSILSSSEDIPLDPETVLAAEVGLSGELRPITQLLKRIEEAEKLGFQSIIVSSHALKGIQTENFKIEIKAFKSVVEVFQDLFG